MSMRMPNRDGQDSSPGLVLPSGRFIPLDVIKSIDVHQVMSDSDDYLVTVERNDGQAAFTSLWTESQVAAQLVADGPPTDEDPSIRRSIAALKTVLDPLYGLVRVHVFDPARR